MTEPRASRVDVAVGVALALATVTLYLEYQRHAGPLWRDEVNSVNVATLPSLYEVYSHSHLDSFPTAWVIVLHAWVVAGLGDSDGSLRVIGLLIGVATVATWWWTGRRLGLPAPLLTLLLLGMSPTMIIYGTQVRGYGLGVLGLSCCLGAIFHFVTLPSWRTYVLAQGAAILAVQTYFGNCFLLASVCAGGVAVCLRRKATRLAGAVIALGAVAAASMVVNLFSVEYAAALASIEQGNYDLRWYAETFWQALGSGAALLSVAWVLGASLAAVGCGLTRLARSAQVAESDRDRATYVWVAAATGLPGYAAYVEYISVRTQVWYYLPLMAVVAFYCDVGTDLLAKRFRWGGATRAAAVILLASLVARDAAQTVRIRMTNVDVIADTLERDARPGDLIVVFPWHCGITFQRYYRGSAPWITLPDFDEHAYHLHTVVAEKMKLREAAVAPELARVERTLRQGGRVWVAGPLVAPQPGTLPRALPGVEEDKHRANVYLDNWEQQLGTMLQAHAQDVWNVPLPEVGAVNAWESLPLVLAVGWR